MCGIAGCVSHSESNSDNSIESLISLLSHRGPDDLGVAVFPKVAIGMTRLSIIDLEGGKQPLYNEDKSVVVVGNGEIYNYKEICNTFLSKHVLSSQSDIETIVHLYEDYGIEAVNKLIGMFAFALYDIKKGLVYLVRDRLGEKPLYYYQSEKKIYFASELKALVHLPDVKKTLDFNSLHHYFHFNFIPEPATAIAEIKKLPAASYIKINVETLEINQHQYWEFNSNLDADSDDIYADVQYRFIHACNNTLTADVPVGITLSGGIDSSSIATVCSVISADRLKAYSVGYHFGGTIDERNLARELCKKYGIDFYDKTIDDSLLVKNFPHLVYAVDDPIAEIGANSISELYKFVNECGVKVVLSGVGGDELFWGYPWVGQAVQKSLQSFREDRENYLILNQLRPNFLGEKKFSRHFYTKEFKRGKDKKFYDTLFKYTGNIEGVPFAAMKSIVDNWLVSEVNTIIDRLSMSHSVEVRSPFLDHRLFELVAKSQTLQQAYDKDQKYYLKTALDAFLPESVKKMPKKGFTPPAIRWLFLILYNYSSLLSDGFLVRNQILSKYRIAALAKTWPTIPFYWYQIFQMVVLEVWCREYIEGQDPASLSR